MLNYKRLTFRRLILLSGMLLATLITYSQVNTPVTCQGKQYQYDAMGFVFDVTNPAAPERVGIQTQKLECLDELLVATYSDNTQEFYLGKPYHWEKYDGTSPLVNCGTGVYRLSDGSIYDMSDRSNPVMIGIKAKKLQCLNDQLEAVTNDGTYRYYKGQPFQWSKERLTNTGNNANNAPIASTTPNPSTSPGTNTGISTPNPGPTSTGPAVAVNNAPPLPTNAQSGGMLYQGSSGWQSLPKGKEGEVLTVKGGMPSWAAFLSNAILPANAQTGDMLYQDNKGWQRLPKGQDNEVLTVQSGMPAWVEFKSNKLPEPPEIYSPMMCVGRSGKATGPIFANKATVNLEVIFVDWIDKPATNTNFQELWDIIATKQTLKNEMIRQSHQVIKNLNINLNKQWKRMKRPVTQPNGTTTMTEPPLSTYFETRPDPNNPGQCIKNPFDPTKCKQFWLGDRYVEDASRGLAKASYPDNTILIIVANKGLVPPGRLPSACLGPSTDAKAKGIQSVVTAGPKIYNDNYLVMLHEIGHAFGLPDLYPEEAVVPNPKPAGWTAPPPQHNIGGYALMGDVRGATSFIGWYQYRFGWMPKERTRMINQKGAYQLELTKVSGQNGVAMVVIPDDKKTFKYWIIEIGQNVIRQKDKKLVNKEGDKVIVYTVEANPPKGNEVKLYMRSAPSNPAEHLADAWFKEVSFVEGQKIVGKSDVPFEFEVLSKTNDGFEIKVELLKDITLSAVGCPENATSANGTYQLKAGGDGNVVITKTDPNNSYVWDAFSKLFTTSCGATAVDCIGSKAKAVFLEDGKIKLIDTNTGATVSQKNVNAPANSKLSVSDTGKLQVEDASGNVVWTDS